VRLGLYLGSLRLQSWRRLARLRLLVDQCRPPLNTEEDRIVAYATIEALNLWDSFVRAYYLSCVVTRALTDSGVRITTNVALPTVDDAIDFAVKQIYPATNRQPPWSRRDEPRWYVPGHIIKIMTSAQASNRAHIIAAFGYQTAVFANLPTARNFFAHRNADTAEKVSAIAGHYTLSARLRPSDLLCSRLPGRPQALLSDWLDDLREVIVLLCK
jgi:hypothetical protein